MPICPPRQGRVVVMGGEAGAGALRRAADVLAFARHPGIPELLAVRDGAGATELEMWLPDAAPLRTLALTVEEVAGVTATVATTVADLHDIGVAVGGLALEGVVVTSDGQSVLTDFTRALRLPGAPTRWHDHPAARRDDRDLGRLLTDLLDMCAPAELTDGLEASRPWPRAWASRKAAPPSVALRRLAERAATRLLDSRRLAESLARDIPGVCLPHRPSGSGTAASPFVGHVTDVGHTSDVAPGTDVAHASDAAPATDAAPAANATVAADAGFERWFERPIPTQAPARRRAHLAWAVVACAPLIAAVIAVARSSSTSPPAPCSPGTSTCAMDGGPTVSLDGLRYSVGQRGDVLTTGRWWCGDSLLALLRPSTGQVWLYPAWPSPSAPTAPILGATVAGAKALAVQHGGRCDELLVVERSGPRVPLSIPGAT